MITINGKKYGLCASGLSNLNGFEPSLQTKFIDSFVLIIFYYLTYKYNYKLLSRIIQLISSRTSFLFLFCIVLLDEEQLHHVFIDKRFFLSKNLIK